MHSVRVFALVLGAMALPLVAQQGTGYLKAHVKPGRAGVFIDGKYVGPAANFRVARKYTVAAGEHEVRLLDPRYEELVTKVRIEPGKTAKLEETMKPLPLAKPPFGTLRVIYPDKFAAVYLNGRFSGHAGEFNNSLQGFLLPPGEYEVKVEPVGGGQAVTNKVSVVANQVAVVHAGK